MRPSDQDPFFQYAQTRVPTSAGEIPVPAFYYDSSHFVALFTPPIEPAMDMLQDKGLRPLPVLGGKALAAVACFEYRASDAGAYREVAVALAAFPQDLAPSPVAPLDLLRALDRRRAGWCILNLPVTTELSCAAGREIWGYPKFVTRIDFSLRGREFEGAVYAPGDGDAILSLGGRTSIGVPMSPVHLVLYSRHEGQLLRTIVNVRNKITARRPGPLRLHVGPSTHEMAQRLQQLGLHGKKPHLVLTTHEFQARLNQGAPIAQLQENAAPER